MTKYEVTINIFTQNVYQNDVEVEAESPNEALEKAYNSEFKLDDDTLVRSEITDDGTQKLKVWSDEENKYVNIEIPE